MQEWHTGTPGELHPRFLNAIDLAKRSLEEETNVVLKPFWEWRLELAERDLNRANGALEEGEDF
jgi:hypothetical protein